MSVRDYITEILRHKMISKFKKKSPLMFVLVRSDWTSKIIHCPFMYKPDLKGYELAVNHQKMLNRMFPEIEYKLEMWDFSGDLETQVKFHIVENFNGKRIVLTV